MFFLLMVIYDRNNSRKKVHYNHAHRWTGWVKLPILTCYISKKVFVLFCYVALFCIKSVLSPTVHFINITLMNFFTKLPLLMTISEKVIFHSMAHLNCFIFPAGPCYYVFKCNTVFRMQRSIVFW